MLFKAVTGSNNDLRIEEKLLFRVCYLFKLVSVHQRVARGGGDGTHGETLSIENKQNIKERPEKVIFCQTNKTSG